MQLAALGCRPICKPQEAVMGARMQVLRYASTRREALQLLRLGSQPERWFKLVEHGADSKHPHACGCTDMRCVSSMFLSTVRIRSRNPKMCMQEHQNLYFNIKLHRRLSAAHRLLEHEVVQQPSCLAAECLCTTLQVAQKILHQCLPVLKCSYKRHMFRPLHTRVREK